MMQSQQRKCGFLVFLLIASYASIVRAQDLLLDLSKVQVFHLTMKVGNNPNLITVQVELDDNTVVRKSINKSASDEDITAAFEELQKRKTLRIIVFEDDQFFSFETQAGDHELASLEKVIKAVQGYRRIAPQLDKLGVFNFQPFPGVQVPDRVTSAEQLERDMTTRIEAVQQDLQFKADRRIREMDQSSDLTAKQIDKLHAASTSDIGRSTMSLVEMRNNLISEKNFRLIDLQYMQLAFDRAASRTSNTDCFGESSLFAKIGANLLTDRQKLHAEEYRHRQNELAVQAAVKRTVAYLEGFTHLSVDQQSKLIAMMNSQPISPDALQSHESYVGFIKLKRINQTDLAEFLDKQQLKAIERCLTAYKEVLANVR